MEHAAMAARERGGNVLIVEDPFVRAFVKTYLTRHGFRVLPVEMEQAVESLRSGTEIPDLLITNRPGMLPLEACRIPLLYIASFPDPVEVVGFRRARLLRKPFRPEQLLAGVMSLLSDVAAAS